MDKRKIIQIEISKGGTLIALCDNGSIWSFNEEEWEKFPNIPQERTNETS